jgi:succinoglycan biosynthesis protein ExoO
MNETLMPDVSFVIAAYNARETIGLAIESALAQVGVAVEVVVADDCSTDGTAELVRYFGDPRVRLVERSQNGGPGAARNDAIAAARGRWIAVLDSDDEVLPERSAAMIATAGRLSADMVVDNVMVLRPGHRRQAMFPEPHLQRLSSLSLEEFIRSNVLFRSTFNFGYMKPMFERVFLERHALRFDENLRIGEDYIFLASALACGGTCAVEPQPGYLYHVRDGSISRVLRREHVTAMMEADRRFVRDFALQGPATKAQAVRYRSLKEALAFIDLVEAIKGRAWRDCLNLAISQPSVLRHLKMPVQARLRRWVGPALRLDKASP